MKYNIIKKSMFFAIDENGKRYLLDGNYGNYYTYEEIQHKDVELDVDTIGSQPSKLSKEDEDLISEYIAKRKKELNQQ